MIPLAPKPSSRHLRLVRSAEPVPAASEVAVARQKLTARLRWPHARTLIVALTGEIDLATAPRLGTLLSELLHRTLDHLVLELDDLRFLGASGVRELAAAQELALRTGTTLSLVVDPFHPVARVLRLAGADRIQPLYPTSVEARRDTHGR